MAAQNIFGPLATEETLAKVLGQSLAHKVSEGKVFTCGTETVLTAIATRSALHLINPVGSGKTLHVVSWSVYIKTGSGGDVRYLFNPTVTGVPLAVASRNMKLGAAQPVSVATSQTGTALFSDVDPGLITRRHRTRSDFPLERFDHIEIPPGNSVAMRYSGANNDVVDMNFEWYEEV